MATSNNDQFRILVLEDDLISQVSASQVIQRAAPECILLMARSLAEGRRFLAKYEFHLCVLDIQLPDGSGIDFLYDIQISSPRACVAILTGVPLPHYRDQAEAFGVLHFMEKPADAKVLDEDAETGAKKYRYVRVGEDHFSLAFTYAWMAAQDQFIRGPMFSVFSMRPDDPWERW